MAAVAGAAAAAAGAVLAVPEAAAPALGGTSAGMATGVTGGRGGLSSSFTNTKCMRRPSLVSRSSTGDGGCMISFSSVSLVKLCDRAMPSTKVSSLRASIGSVGRNLSSASTATRHASVGVDGASRISKLDTLLPPMICTGD